MKLNSIAIISVGFFIMVAAVMYGLFDHFMPNNKEAKLNTDLAAELDRVIQGKGAAEKRLKKAEDKVRAAAAKWNAIAAVHTPPASLKQGGVNLGGTPHQLVVDSIQFRDVIQDDMNRTSKIGGVKVINGPAVQQLANPESADQVLSTFYNYPALPYPVVVMDFGTITVEGTYQQIMANVRHYGSITKYLAVADGLQLTGTSPNMRGTYNLSVVAFIRGNKIAPAVDVVKGGGGSGTGGGAAGGGAGGPGLGGPGGKGKLGVMAG